MNRDAPKGVPPYATPAKQRDSRSLRSQLTRAVGDALRAVRNSKTATSSRQRLNDMLWNDRTLLASARVVGTGQADADEVTNPRGSLPSPDMVEVASDGEVAEWFDAALEEVVDRPTDPQTADNFADAIESAAEDRPRRNGSAPTARQATPAPAAVTWEPLRPRSVTPVQLTAATDAARVRKSTPAKLPEAPAPAASTESAVPEAVRVRKSTPAKLPATPAPAILTESAEPEEARIRRSTPVKLSATPVPAVAPAIESAVPEAVRVRKSTPAKLPDAPAPAAVMESAVPEAARVRKSTPAKLPDVPAPTAVMESAVPEAARVRKSTPPKLPDAPAPAAAVDTVAPDAARARKSTPAKLAAAPAPTLAPSHEPAARPDPVKPSQPLAAPPATAARSKAAALEDDGDEGGEEPIQTRSMARLLAMQGHRHRALAIYDALLRADTADASLRAEADALRQSG